MKIKGSVLKPMRFSYGIERDRCCLFRKTARRSLCRLSRKLRETVFYYGLSPWELQLQNMHKMVTICLLSPDRERPTAMPRASRSWTSVLVLLRPAAGAAHIAGGGGIRRDQPRHVDIVRFPPSPGPHDSPGCRPHRRRQKRPIRGHFCRFIRKFSSTAPPWRCGQRRS